MGSRQANPLAPLNLISDQALSEGALDKFLSGLEKWSEEAHVFYLGSVNIFVVAQVEINKYCPMAIDNFRYDLKDLKIKNKIGSEHIDASRLSVQKYRNDMMSGTGILNALQRYKVHLFFSPLKSLICNEVKGYFLELIPQKNGDLSPKSAHQVISLREIGFGYVYDRELFVQAIRALVDGMFSSVHIELAASSLPRLANCAEALASAKKYCVSAGLSLSIIPDCLWSEQGILDGLAALRSCGFSMGIALDAGSPQGWRSGAVINPDFITVSAALLRSTLAGEENMQSLAKIAALSYFLAPLVLVRGIDSEQLRKNAVTAGFHWGEETRLGHGKPIFRPTP